MKVFYTPAIDGQYRTDLQKRLEDQDDNGVYNMLKAVVGEVAIDELSDRGYTKMLTRDNDGKVTGYFTYQQDDL